MYEIKLCVFKKKNIIFKNLSQMLEDFFFRYFLNFAAKVDNICATANRTNVRCLYQEFLLIPSLSLPIPLDVINLYGGKKKEGGGKKSESRRDIFCDSFLFVAVSEARRLDKTPVHSTSEKQTS